MLGELELLPSIMDRSSSRERDNLIDLESGTNAPSKEEESISSDAQSRKKVWNMVWSGFVGIDGLVKGEDAVKLDNSNKNNKITSPVELPITNIPQVFGADKRIAGEEESGLVEKKAGLEKPKKKSCKKPPRPPKSSSPLGEADQKLIKELSDLAALKQARIERMKKKLKSTKSTSNSNFYGLIITIFFCIVIIWQGFLSHGNANITFHGSPESSVHKLDKLIIFQDNVPGSTHRTSSLASSVSNVEPESRIDDHTNA